jgi:hypothetical protein
MAILALPPARTFMYPYIVVDTNRDNRLVALQDSNGLHHVAYCTSDLPPVNSALSGTLPAVGFAQMAGPGGETCRLILGEVNCSQSRALRLLRPELMVPELGNSDRTTPAANFSPP